MADLIEALTILMKYGNLSFPTACEHDVLYILVDPDVVSGEDITHLEQLGLLVDTELGCFYSFKYGSG